MFIETVSTPNPNTLKFIPGCEVLPGETREYKNQLEAQESPLAVKIFSIDGVSGVFFSNDFITVTKSNFEWPQLKPIILGEIMEHFLSENPLITGQAQQKKEEFYNSQDSDLVEKIKELIALWHSVVSSTTTKNFLIFLVIFKIFAKFVHIIRLNLS